MSPVAKQAAYLKKKKVTPVSYEWVSWLLPLIIISAVLFYAKEYLSNPDTLPINKIHVYGEFVNVDEKILHQEISNSVSGGYFNINVEKVRTIVEKLAWVDEASVRRVWPDTLSVSVIEQNPVAIFKKTGFINKKGHIFKPAKNIKNKTLPVFDGDLSLAELMLDKFYEMNKILSKNELKITYLNINARHAVELTLNNGLKIMLGRYETIPRLERFISIYPRLLANQVNKIDVIDLRYTNGMAVSWKNKNKFLGDMKNV